jgi:FkbM family methyltransferase
LNNNESEMLVTNPYRRNESIRAWGFAFLRAACTLVPGKRARQSLAEFVLRFKQNVPREMMIIAGDTVVQIGTPQTETVRRIAKSIGKHGKAVVVEADETNVSRLRNWLDSKSINNVKLIHQAAADRKGVLTFLVSKKWSGNHRLLDDSIVNDNDQLEFDATGSEYLRKEVPADTVDGICAANNIDHIDYIEIAINGAELAVLRTMPEILKKTNRLFVKGHSREKETGEPICYAIKALLDNQGFRTRLTCPSRAGTAEWGKREGDVYAWRV